MKDRNLFSFQWTTKVLSAVKLVICEPFMFKVGDAEEGYEVGKNWAPADDFETNPFKEPGNHFGTDVPYLAGDFFVATCAFAVT